MNEANELINKVIHEFEVSPDPYLEWEVHTALSKMQDQAMSFDSNTQETLKAEQMAFGFQEDYQCENGGWGGSAPI